MPKTFRLSPPPFSRLRSIVKATSTSASATNSLASRPLRLIRVVAER
jgi:hypothetical protein